MKKMYVLTTLIFSLNLSFNALAEDKTIEKDNFLKDKKAQITKLIDQRIASLEKSKVCVEKAETPDAMKACRDEHKEEIGQLRNDFKDLKKEWKHHRKNHQEHDQG